MELLAHDYLLGNDRRAVFITEPDGRMRGIVALSDLRKVPREQWYTTPAAEIMTLFPAQVGANCSSPEAHAAAGRTYEIRPYVHIVKWLGWTQLMADS